MEKLTLIKKHKMLTAIIILAISCVISFALLISVAVKNNNMREWFNKERALHREFIDNYSESRHMDLVIEKYKTLDENRELVRQNARLAELGNQINEILDQMEKY